MSHTQILEIGNYLCQRLCVGSSFLLKSKSEYKHAFLKVCAEMDPRRLDSSTTMVLSDLTMSLMYNKLGADIGFDSIGEFTTAKAMAQLPQ